MVRSLKHDADTVNAHDYVVDASAWSFASREREDHSGRPQPLRPEVGRQLCERQRCVSLFKLCFLNGGSLCSRLHGSRVPDLFGIRGWGVAVGEGELTGITN